MGIKKHSSTALALGPQNVAHQPSSHRVEARGGFVEEDQLRLVYECLGQSDALEHPLGKTLEAPVAMRRQFPRLAQPSVQVKQLAGGEPIVKPKVFGQETDLAPYGLIPGRTPEYDPSPLVGL